MGVRGPSTGVCGAGIGSGVFGAGMDSGVFGKGMGSSRRGGGGGVGTVGGVQASSAPLPLPLPPLPLPVPLIHGIANDERSLYNDLLHPVACLTEKVLEPKWLQTLVSTML